MEAGKCRLDSLYAFVYLVDLAIGQVPGRLNFSLEVIMPVAMPQPGRVRQPVPKVCLAPDFSPCVRPARVADVHGMSALINQYASANVMLARGPQYLYEHIQDYLVVTAPNAEDGSETVIACGAVHVHWGDLAEIRSVAVHDNCQHGGIGRLLVRALMERCRFLGITRVFVFTLADDFFKSLGFEIIDRDMLPPVVWVECSKCPKFYRCDESCLLAHIN